MALTQSIFEIEKCFFLTGQNFTRNKLVMLSVSYAGKTAYSAGKTCGVLRGGASGANMCYGLAHCGGGWTHWAQM